MRLGTGDGIMHRVIDDPQAKDVYKAEWDAFGAFLGFFTDTADAQAYIDYIVKSKWWRNRSAVTNITVEYGRNQGKWCYGYRISPTEGKIELLRARLCEGFILHELAHILTVGAKYDHGPAFCAKLLEVIERWVSPHTAADLRHAFDKYEVDYKPK
jgi:putative metallohydrolase (TIGR04338 family)